MTGQPTELPPLLRDLVCRRKVRSRIIALIGGGALIAAGVALIVTIVRFTASEGRLSEPRPEELGPMLGAAAGALVGLIWIAMTLRRHRAWLLVVPGVRLAKAYLENVTTVGSSYDRRLTLVMITSTDVRIEIPMGSIEAAPRLEHDAAGLMRELQQWYPSASTGWTLADAIREVEKVVARDGSTPEIDRALAEGRALTRRDRSSPRPM